MAENLLDILTRAERPTFTIDGRHFEMRHPNELSMLEFKQLARLGSKLQRAGQVATGDDPEGGFDEIAAVMGELLDLVTPDLPGDVRGRLNPFHVMQIVQAFTGLVRATPAPGEQRSRGRSSRGLSASTAARRTTG